MQMWRSPWDNAVRGGDQVAQGLWGLAAGAVSGTGAGLGHTRFVPEGHTDLVLAAIGEELGLVGLLDRRRRVCPDRLARNRTSRAGHRPTTGSFSRSR